MLPQFPPSRTLIETAETLAIALAGGAAFALLGLPAGLVSGSVLAVAAAALLGRPVRLPLPLARVCYVIVGALLGTVVTPATLHGVTTWPASIALLMLASLAMIAATMAYLCIVHRWDTFSALLGSSPGAMAQVIALSTELGGDLRAIAIVQTVRVLLLVLGLPNGLALFGLVVPALPVPRGPAGFSVLGEMIVLVAVSTAFALAFLRLRFPGGLLFGALAGSGLLHGTGLIDAALPWWLGSSAVVVLGALVGSRFANTSLRMLVSYLGAALGSFAVAMAVATLFIAIVVHLFGFPIANVVIAFRAGRAGYHDGAGAGAASRSGLRRRASLGAFSRRHRRYCSGGAAGGAARLRVSRRQTGVAAHLALRISSLGGSITAVRNGGFCI